MKKLKVIIFSAFLGILLVSGILISENSYQEESNDFKTAENGFFG